MSWAATYYVVALCKLVILLETEDNCWCVVNIYSANSLYTKYIIQEIMSIVFALLDKVYEDLYVYYKL